jgi:hypothetical protein
METISRTHEINFEDGGQPHPGPYAGCPPRLMAATATEDAPLTRAYGCTVK